MKFQPDRAEGVNTITRHDASSIWVGQVGFGHSLLVPWHGEVQAWAPARFDQLLAEHFEQALALQPELVIFGSGSAPPLHRAGAGARPDRARASASRRWTRAAACRTYNVLASEGRAVLAALLLEPALAPAA